ncbi:hypothetical protein BHE74_00008714, partial [Ensete ventricosum]
KGHSKSVGIPDHEAITRKAPGDHLIGYRVIDHVEGLRKERRRPNFVQPLHRPWRLHKRIFYVIGTRLRSDRVGAGGSWRLAGRRWSRLELGSPPPPVFRRYYPTRVRSPPMLLETNLVWQRTCRWVLAVGHVTCEVADEGACSLSSFCLLRRHEDPNARHVSPTFPTRPPPALHGRPPRGPFTAPSHLPLSPSSSSTVSSSPPLSRVPTSPSQSPTRMWARPPYAKGGGAVEAGIRALYPVMLEPPELRWAFIRKIYSILSAQMLITVAVATAVVSIRPVSHFFVTSSAGLGLYVFLVILPFFGTPSFLFLLLLLLLLLLLFPYHCLYFVLGYNSLLLQFEMSSRDIELFSVLVRVCLLISDDDFNFPKHAVICPLYYYYQHYPLNYLLLGIFTVSLGFAVGLTCAFTSGWIDIFTVFLFQNQELCCLGHGAVFVWRRWVHAVLSSNLICFFRLCAGKVILESVVLTGLVVVSLTIYTFWAAARGHDFTFLGPFLFSSIMILFVFVLIQVKAHAVSSTMTSTKILLHVPIHP